MRNITEITRRDIFDLFQHGYVEESVWFDSRNINYYYSGRLSEIEFLKKLYRLDKMTNNDRRYRNAEEEIQAHNFPKIFFPISFFVSIFRMKDCAQKI